MFHCLFSFLTYSNVASLLVGICHIIPSLLPRLLPVPRLTWATCPAEHHPQTSAD